MQKWAQSQWYRSFNMELINIDMDIKGMTNQELRQATMTGRRRCKKKTMSYRKKTRPSGNVLLSALSARGVTTFKSSRLGFPPHKVYLITNMKSVWYSLNNNSLLFVPPVTAAEWRFIWLLRKYALKRS